MANLNYADRVQKMIAEIKQSGTDLTPLEAKHLNPLNGKKEFTFREASQVQAVHLRVCPDSTIGSCFATKKTKAAPPKATGLKDTKKTN